MPLSTQGYTRLCEPICAEAGVRPGTGREAILRMRTVSVTAPGFREKFCRCCLHGENTGSVSASDVMVTLGELRLLVGAICAPVKESAREQDRLMVSEKLLPALSNRYAQ